MVATVDPATPVIFLDTGKLFEETQDYREELTALLGLKDVRVARPAPATLGEHDRRHALAARAGPCCHLRKTEVLDRALAGFAAWITGRKRFQGGLRSALPTIEGEPSTGRHQAQPARPLVGRRRRALPAAAQPAGASAGRRRLRLDRLRALHAAGGPWRGTARAGRWWGWTRPNAASIGRAR